MKDHETFYRKVGERIRTKRKARETVARELIALPDLEAYSEEVRAFVEAGINIAKGGDDGDSKTKN